MHVNEIGPESAANSMQPQDEYEATADFYDFVPLYRERPDVAFFVDLARESGGLVLEVGCGTGRVLIPAARAGITITGLDLSTRMLAVCRQRLAAEGEDVRGRVTLSVADMRDFDLGGQFSLVTLPFRPFQHLTTVADQIACLQTVYRHLLPGGCIALDLFNPSIPILADDTRLGGWGSEPEFALPDGRRVVRRFRLTDRDYFNQINQVEMIYAVTHPDERQEEFVHAFPMRYLFRFEAEHLLVRCGFEIEAVYGSYDRSPYGATSYPGELIFVARRPDA